MAAISDTGADTDTATDCPAQAWDRAAHGWNRHAGVIRAWLAQATAAMLDAARLASGMRVLDIAAGAGDQTLDIAQRVGPRGQVLATDLSAGILALAAGNARAAGLAQVQTRVADAQALALDNAGFDAAVCRLGLMFCTAPRAALQSAHAALAPGGRFAALVFGPPQHNPCLALMLSTALRHAGLPARSPFEPGSLMSLSAPGRLAGLLGEAGFVEIEVTALAAPFRLPSSADYVEFVRSAGTPLMQILAPLSPPAQAAAWADMRAQLDAFSTPDGWVGPNQLLLCGATRPA